MANTQNVNRSLLAARCIALLVIQQLFMAERNASQRAAQRGCEYSAGLEMIMVDKVAPELVELVLGKEGTHRSTTNVHRRSRDDYNHTFEWAGRVFIANEFSDEEPIRGLTQ